MNASRIGVGDGLLPLSSPCTVAGVREVFAALLSGATLHLLDPQRAGLNGIRRAIRENGITICYAVPALLRSRLNASVRSSLASALHPAAIHVLDGLPRLPSNKVDTGRLFEIDEAAQTNAQAAPPSVPANPAKAASKLAEQVEAAVLRAWEREAGARSLAENRSWADAGGDSLKLLRLIFELEEALGRSLPVHLFRAEMRASDFIAAITASLTGAGPQEDARPKLFLFPGVNGDDPQLAAFRADLDDMAVPVTIRYPGWEEMLAPGYRFDDLLGLIMRQIDANSSEGPIRLAGYSLGGLLAFAAAEVLLARGREVSFFGILDSSLTHAPLMMRRGAYGIVRRMTRMPSFVLRGSVEDNLVL